MTSGPSRPEVSVLIPVRNGARFIEAQLAALAGQDFPGGFEVVVADNGSTDDTSAILRSWRSRPPHVTVVDASSRVGPGAARNAAARQARGAVLLFCDADDQVSPSWVSAMVRVLDRTDLATGPADLFDESGDDQGVLAAHAPLAEFGFLPYGIGANLGVRRAVFERIGGFDERWPVPGGDDVDFCWRAQLAGAELGFSEDVRIRYRRPARAAAAFRKNLGYGTAGALLARRYAPLGLRRRRLRRLVRGSVELGLRLPFLVTAGRRAPWWRQAGLMAGVLRGSVRRRRYPVDPLGTDGRVMPARDRPGQPGR